MTTGIVTLKPNRDRSLRNRHPWLFSGGIADAVARPGDLVAIQSAKGEQLAWGYYNPRSQIQVRILSWGPTLPDAAWWYTQLERAVALREPLLKPTKSTAVRLVNAESDGLPGLVVDRYGEWLVLQALTLGIDQRKHEIAQQLLEITGASGVYERSDDAVRRLEGVDIVTGVLAGATPPDEVDILENGLLFSVNIATGHKTGFYLDQRTNRALVGAAAQGKTVLNCFAYTGAFSVYAAYNGATHVTSVDSSSPSLELAHVNFELNGLDPEQHDFIEANVFHYLRDMKEEGRTFDIIVLDPPKFAQSQSQLDSATRGYKDINMNALPLLNPGGLLYTFSCSGLVSPDLFQKVLFGAALDAGINAQILQPLWQAPDHPVALTFPEGAYLKGLVVRRVE
jgi:23S rRNA (cytosine1962-C5)-methyltransferase